MGSAEFGVRIARQGGDQGSGARRRVWLCFLLLPPFYEGALFVKWKVSSSRRTVGAHSSIRAFVVLAT